MTVFGAYAKYYDLLYKSKNYSNEVDYVDSLIRKFQPDAKNLLDIGCGTGTHSFFFQEKGYQVKGIDRSDEMINVAQSKILMRDDDSISFEQGDILSFSFNVKFDVVVSLFHVMNYLTSTSELESGFDNILNHVKPGGIFIFDCWYGPAVLNEQPKVGVKRFENEHIKVTRLVEPVLHENLNTVDVNYEIFVMDKESKKVDIINETHSVRYFFETEIKSLAKRTGCEVVCSEEWTSAKPIGKNTFGVCFVFKKQSK